MQILYNSENVKLTEDGNGFLKIYFKDSTLTFENLTDSELKGVAKGILAFIEGDSSIE
jgi:hypothetical protein|tara:strand:- start:792 stop:965 length:174 start_codon:yes stop_codon:yes gene_type:complete